MGPALAVLALGVYLVTLAPGAFPGAPASLVVSHTGLDPFPAMSHPLWGFVVRLLALLPGDIVWKLGIFSAACGAGAVWLFYLIVSRIPHDRTTEEREARFPPAVAGAVSGASAALALAFCAPFWFVANRAHTHAFDALLLLGAVWLLVRFAETRQFRWACWLAYLCGMGTTEFATFISVLPVFALLLGFLLWRDGFLKPRSLATLGLCYGLGLAPYFLAAWDYRLRPAFEWRGFNHYFAVLWFFWREQYREIRFGLPQVGWLLVVLISLLPGMLVVAVRKSAINRSAVLGSMLLHGLITALGLALLFNAPIAPWSLLRIRPLLITPYLVSSAWIGYLAGYWFVLLSQKSRFERPGTQWLRRVMRGAYLPLVVVALAVAGLRNLAAADGRTVVPLQRFAHAVLDSLGGRPWLVSNGILDDLILIEARSRDLRVTVLNADLTASMPYRRYVASLFGRARLKSLVEIGLSPFLQAWLGETPGVADQVAVLSQPDYWFTAGYTPLPSSLAYLGGKETAGDAVRGQFERDRGVWSELCSSLTRAGRRNELVEPWTRWAVQHISKMANNTGVLLEDLGDTNTAVTAYNVARELAPDNASALLNLIASARRRGSEEAGRLNKELETLLRKRKGGVAVWALASQFGYVRAPEAFASRGFAWAMSGKPQAALLEMKRAVATGANREKAELAMASFYLMQEMEEESEEIYRTVLRDSEHNLQAILGMARVAMRKGDFDAARAEVAKLKELGVPQGVVAYETASIEALAGNLPGAAATLARHLEENKNDLRAWILLAAVANEQKDDATLSRAASVLDASGTQHPRVLVALAQIAASRGDFELASKRLNQVLATHPRHITALEWMLQLDVWEGDRAGAEDHLARLIGMDP